MCLSFLSEQPAVIVPRYLDSGAAEADSYPAAVRLGQYEVVGLAAAGGAHDSYVRVRQYEFAQGFHGSIQEALDLGLKS